MKASEIKQKALELGYLNCGIIPVNIFDEYTQYLDERVKTFPKSKRLYNRLYGLARQPENAKSIIVCTQRYNNYKISDSLNGRVGKVYLFSPDESYFSNESYVKYKAYLKQLGINIIKCYVPDRWAAAKAGLGKFGRNNFIYDPQHGSYIWVNAWVVDKELEYDAVEKDIYLSACNDNCNKCIKACPTQAFSGKLSMDRGRCVAHLSWKTGKLPDEKTRVQMGQWIYGCDACQDVCPLNKDKFKNTEENPISAAIEEYLQLERILEMDKDTYVNIIHPQLGYISKSDLWLWKCHALRGMINSGDAKYHDLIKKYTGHEDARIREMAQWGCNTLGL